MSRETLLNEDASTVEDVLREFAEKMNENLGMYRGEAIDADEWREADARTVEKYAAKLRLAEDSQTREGVIQSSKSASGLGF